MGFLRVATNARVTTRPVAISVAWEQLKAWQSVEVVWIPAPTERHAEVLGKLLAQPGVHGNLVPDAHLAALAIEHALTLCSTDRDFSRFQGLRWQNPLA
ncbi:MAG: TA system VapC family ribonuclease toxin [Vicinamibacterales bacterium]